MRLLPPVSGRPCALYYTHINAVCSLAKKNPFGLAGVHFSHNPSCAPHWVVLLSTHYLRSTEHTHLKWDTHNSDAMRCGMKVRRVYATASARSTRNDNATRTHSPRHILRRVVASSRVSGGRLESPHDLLNIMLLLMVGADQLYHTIYSACCAFNSDLRLIALV